MPDPLLRTIISGIPGRLVTTAVVAILVMIAVGSNFSQVEAKGDRIAVFGTAVDAPSDGTLDVATRDGVITLVISDKTKISSRRGRLSLDEVSSGVTVTGYYTKSDDEFTAGSLTFTKRKGQKAYTHLVGVIVDKDDDELTVLTTDGDEVVITSPDDDDSDATDEGSLIVTVVETDPDTGEINAQAIRTAEQTFARLSAAIDHEISLAQEQLLKIRMSETASIHLTRLYDTLDKIQADSQVLIEEAYADFQQSYTTELDEKLLDPPLVQISGRVLSRSAIQLVVATNGNDLRIYLSIPADVKVVLSDGSPGTAGDIAPDDWVNITATSQTSTASPIARAINVASPPDGPDNSGGSDGSGKNNDDTITGTIVLVDAGKSGNQRVVVVSNPDGSDGAAGIDSDTVVTGGSDLEPGQEVEITLSDDGFSADAVMVVSSSGSDATPAPPVEYLLSGKIRSVSGQGVILDDVFLTLDTTSPVTDPLEVGQLIQFKVIIDTDGRWVVVGIES
jgi:hypothetical protein